MFIYCWSFWRRMSWWQIHVYSSVFLQVTRDISEFQLSIRQWEKIEVQHALLNFPRRIWIVLSHSGTCTSQVIFLSRKHIIIFMHNLRELSKGDSHLRNRDIHRLIILTYSFFFFSRWEFLNYMHFVFECLGHL